MNKINDEMLTNRKVELDNVLVKSYHMNERKVTMNINNAKKWLKFGLENI